MLVTFYKEVLLHFSYILGAFLLDFLSVIKQVSCCKSLQGGYTLLGGFLGGLKRYKKIKNSVAFCLIKRGDNNGKSCKISCNLLFNLIFGLFDIGFSGGIKFYTSFCGRLLRAVPHSSRLKYFLLLFLNREFFNNFVVLWFYITFGIIKVCIGALEIKRPDHRSCFGFILSIVRGSWFCTERDSDCIRAVVRFFVRDCSRNFRYISNTV